MTQILYRPHHSAHDLGVILNPGETDWTLTNPNPMETAGSSSNFGKALSSYKEYLVVGEPNNGVGGDFGSFTLYSTPDNGTSWIKIAKIFPPVGYSTGVKDFATAVSIYGDYILIGSPGDTINGVANAGSVYAYTFNPSTKVLTFRERILQSTTVENSYFGREVDHYEDNAVIACDNGPQATSTKIAYAYKTTDRGKTWQLTSSLIPVNTVGALKFGYELFIFGDWITIAAYAENNNVGRVYIYRTFDSGDSWIRTQIIDTTAQVADTYFGFAMAMNEKILALGAPGANAGKGTVYVYGQEVSGLNITWVLRSTIQPPAGNVTDFAKTVTLQDGVLLVGAPGTQNTNSTGAIYLYLDDDVPGTYLETPITIPAPAGVDHDFGGTVVITPGAVSVGGGGTIYTYPAPVSKPSFPKIPSNYTPVVSDPVVVSTFGYPTPITFPAVEPRYSTHRDILISPTPSGGIVYHYGGGNNTTATRTLPGSPGRVVHNTTVYHSPGSGSVYIGGGSPSTNEVIFYRSPSPTVDFVAPIVIKPPVTSVKGVPVFNFGIELFLDGNSLTIMDGNGNVFTYTTSDDGTTWDYIGALNIPGVSGAANMVRFGDTLVVTQPGATRYGVAASGMMQIYVTFDGGKNWVLTTVNYPTDSTLEFGRAFKEDHNLLVVSARRLRTDGTYEGVLYTYALNRSTLVWNQISVIADPITTEHLESFGSAFDFRNNTITVTVEERAVSFGTSTVYIYQTKDNGRTWALMRTLETPKGTVYAAITESGLVIGGTSHVMGQPDKTAITLLPANSGVTSVYLNEAYVPDAANYSTPIKVLLGGATSGYVYIEYATVEALTTVPGGVGDIFSIADQNGNLLESVPLSLRYESYGYGCVAVAITPTTGFLTITPTSSSYWRATCFSPAQWAGLVLSDPLKGVSASEVNAVLQDSMSPSCARRISCSAVAAAIPDNITIPKSSGIAGSFTYSKPAVDYYFTIAAAQTISCTYHSNWASGYIQLFDSSNTRLTQVYYYGDGPQVTFSKAIQPGQYRIKVSASIAQGQSCTYNLFINSTGVSLPLGGATGLAAEPMWYATAMLRTKSGTVAFTGLCDKTCKVSLYASGSTTPIDVPGGFTSALQTKTVTLTPNTTYFVVALVNTTVGQATYLSLKAVDSGSTILVTSRDWRVLPFSRTTYAAAGVKPVEKSAYIFENASECTAYMGRNSPEVGALVLLRPTMYLWTGQAASWATTGVITIANSAFEYPAIYTNPLTGNRYYVDSTGVYLISTSVAYYEPELAAATVAAISARNSTTYNVEIGKNKDGANLAAFTAKNVTVHNVEVGANEAGTNLAAIQALNATVHNVEVGANEAGANVAAISAARKAAYTYVPPVIPTYNTANFIEGTTTVSKYAYSMAYGNNTFVCLDYIGVSNPGNKAYTSPDGITWTQKTLSFSSLWIDVTYGNGMFVAITKSSTNRVSTSPDGITWTTRTLPVTAEWSSVAYGNGTFVVTSSSANKAVVYSANGIDWSVSIESSAKAWRVAYGTGKFVAVALNSAECMYSPDGLAWYTGTMPSASSWYDVAYGSGLFVAVAYNSNKIATSPDGATWTERTLPSTDYWYRIVYGNSTFVITGIGPTDTALVSTDGINWATKNMPSDLQYRAVAFGNNKFVAHGYNTNKVAILSDDTYVAPAPPPPAELVTTYVHNNTNMTWYNNPTSYLTKTVAFTLTAQAEVVATVKQTSATPVGAYLKLYKSGVYVSQVYCNGNGSYSYSATLQAGSYEWRIVANNFTGAYSRVFSFTFTKRQ